MKQFVDLRNKSLVLDFKMVKLFQYFQSFGEEKLHIDEDQKVTSVINNKLTKTFFLVLFVREILHNVTDLPKMKCIHLFYMYCLEIVTDMLYRVCIRLYLRVRKQKTTAFILKI